MPLEIVNPASLGAPRGYSNGILAPAGGRLLWVAGQIGWDSSQRIVAGDIAAQFQRAAHRLRLALYLPWRHH